MEELVERSGLKANNRRKVLDLLAERRIPYEMEEHAAAYTIEEMEALRLRRPECVCKNLFLRDAKGRRHFLVTLRGDKHADLASLAEGMGSTKLSFASEERLLKYLGVEHGSVSPLCVLNDREAQVEVFFDRDLKALPVLGVHPNDNTATLYLPYEAVKGIVTGNGNPFGEISI